MRLKKLTKHEREFSEDSFTEEERILIMKQEGLLVLNQGVNHSEYIRTLERISQHAPFPDGIYVKRTYALYDRETVQIITEADSILGKVTTVDYSQRNSLKEYLQSGNLSGEELQSAIYRDIFLP